MNAPDDFLELFDKPAWVVDRERRLLAANRAGDALLSIGDPVTVSAGRVGCRQTGDQRAMTVAHRLLILGPETRRHVGLYGEGRSVPVVLMLARLTSVGALFGQRERSGEPGEADAILTMVHDLQALRVASSDVVADLLSLTQAEARVATQLAEGKSVMDIAVLSGISLHTVRTHLRSIFGKTGTGRQADVVRLVGGIPCDATASACPKASAAVFQDFPRHQSP